MATALFVVPRSMPQNDDATARAPRSNARAVFPRVVARVWRGARRDGEEEEDAMRRARAHPGADAGATPAARMTTRR